MSAAVAASVCNVSGECRRMRPSILGSSQKLRLSSVRLRTGSLQAGRNESSARPRTPQERNTSRSRRKTPHRAATRPRAKRAKATMSSVHNAMGRHRRTTMRKKGTYTRAMKQRPRPPARAARGAASRQNSASAPRPHLTDVRKLVKSDASARHLNEWDRSTFSPKQEIR